MNELNEFNKAFWTIEDLYETTEINTDVVTYRNNTACIVKREHTVKIGRNTNEFFPNWETANLIIHNLFKYDNMHLFINFIVGSYKDFCGIYMGSFYTNLDKDELSEVLFCREPLKHVMGFPIDSIQCVENDRKVRRRISRYIFSKFNIYQKIELSLRLDFTKPPQKIFEELYEDVMTQLYKDCYTTNNIRINCKTLFNLNIDLPEKEYECIDEGED